MFLAVRAQARLLLLLAAGAVAAGVPASDRPAAAPYRLAVWPRRALAPDFALVDTDGRARTLADYRGSVVVVFFGFLRCPDVCPAELLKLSLAMRHLGPSSARVRVLFVTLDPERDAPPLLKKYVAAFDARFIGLTGTNAQVGHAADQFHVEYARVASGADYTIDHSASTFLLDANGRLRLVGAPSTSATDYAHDLAALAAETR